MSAHRVLFLDIETAPSLVHMWRPTDQYTPMDMMVEHGFMLNWGAKWRGGKKFFSGTVTPDEALDRDDRRVVTDLADLIAGADTVVGHNIDGFDLPQVNNRLLYWNEMPLGPVATIDTYKLAKKSFNLPYNRLDYLGEFLGEGRKIKTDMDLWKGCVAGDEASLRRMARYNRQDVLLLERVFERMVPYVKGLRRLHDADRFGEVACPTCGEHDFVKDGFYRTQVSTWQRLQCTNCLRHTRVPAAEKDRRLGVNPL